MTEGVGGAEDGDLGGEALLTQRKNFKSCSYLSRLPLRGNAPSELGPASALYAMGPLLGTGTDIDVTMGTAAAHSDFGDPDPRAS